MEEESPSSPSPSPTCRRGAHAATIRGRDDEEADPDFRQINSVLRNLHLERIRAARAAAPAVRKAAAECTAEGAAGRLSTDRRRATSTGTADPPPPPPP